jgi:hypothetical protein
MGNPVSCLLDRCGKSERFSEGSRIVDAFLGDMQVCKELLQLADREARALDLNRMHLNQRGRGTQENIASLFSQMFSCCVFFPLEIRI